MHPGTYQIELDPLEDARPLINNLTHHFGGAMEEQIDLRVDALRMVRSELVIAAVDEFRPSRTPWKAIRGGLKFVATTGIVFAVLFISLNLGAYKQIFTYWYSSINPNAEKSDEQKLLASLLETNPARADEALAAELSDEGDTIDYRAIEVAPPNDYLIIPKLSLTVPLVYPTEDLLLKEDWNGLEAQIQTALQDGVVHYPGTAMPGEQGNVFYTGHSSYYPTAPGNYKDVFALLPELKVGDEVAVWHDGVRYVYQAFDIQTVKPEDTQILSQMNNEYESILTLMTCTPIGTALNRHVVRFKQTYPSPIDNEPMEGNVIIGGILNA